MKRHWARLLIGMTVGVALALFIPARGDIRLGVCSVGAKAGGSSVHFGGAEIRHEGTTVSVGDLSANLGALSAHLGCLSGNVGH